VNIPGYKIERLIGRGGMAAVYLAIQESLNRPVALKVMLPGFADAPELSDRFLNEGRIIAALNHPNIITIHDIGIADDGHYISMEYVDGGDLRQRIVDGVTPEATLALLEVMGGCLHFAHQRHIVHRDVKPANILFRKGGTPLLTDFGIAKHLKEGIERTVTGTVMGSPHYLSPEQARGEPVDGRSDLYSLGVILFEMLTGEKPFRGETDVSIIFQHLQQPVPRLPAELERFQPLLDRMLAKQPAGRFEDAKAMLEFVRGMGRSGLTSANTGKGGRDAGGLGRSAAGKPPTQDRRSRRLRVWAALAVGGLLAGAAFLALGLRLWSLGVPQAAPPALARVAPRPDPPVTKPETAESDEKRPVEAKPSPPAEKPVAVAKSDASPGKPAKATRSTPKSATAARARKAPRPAPRKRRAESAVSRHSNEKQANLGRIYSHRSKSSPPKPTNAGRVDRLLRLADAALKRYRLTTPAGDNAYEYYRKVLGLDPANRRAKRGISNVADRYAGLAEGSLAKYEYGKARRYVALGLKVQPDNRHLRRLRRDARWQKAPEHLWKDIRHGVKDIGGDIQDIFRGF
jgi:serine/threonine-protein kinase PpkA